MKVGEIWECIKTTNHFYSTVGYKIEITKIKNERISFEYIEFKTGGLTTDRATFLEHFEKIYE